MSPGRLMYAQLRVLRGIACYDDDLHARACALVCEVTVLPCEYAVQ